MNTGRDQLRLSDIFIISPARINPNATKAEATSAVLCEKWGIKPPNFSGFVTMSAYLFPRASLARLETIILANNFLFYVDDCFDRHDPEMQAHQVELRERNLIFARIFAGQAQPDRGNNLHLVCYELRQRFVRLANDGWMARFRTSLRDHLIGVVHQGERQRPLGLEEYMDMRVLDSGMKPAIELNEFANDLYLSPRMLEDPDIQRMDRNCALFASLTNDLFSYEKEVMTYGSNFNLLAVLMENEGYDFLRAVDAAVGLINGCSTEFLAASEAVQERYGDDLVIHSYIQGLREQFTATWHWQISTPRYRSPHSPFAELRCGPGLATEYKVA